MAAQRLSWEEVRSYAPVAHMGSQGLIDWLIDYLMYVMSCNSFRHHMINQVHTQADDTVYLHSTYDFGVVKFDVGRSSGLTDNT